MAKFHGPKNLHLGVPVWAASEYDHDSRDYVIEVTGEDLKRFRAVAGGYGFVEDRAAEKAAPAKADKGA